MISLLMQRVMARGSQDGDKRGHGGPSPPTTPNLAQTRNNPSGSVGMAMLWLKGDGNPLMRRFVSTL